MASFLNSVLGQTFQILVLYVTLSSLLKDNLEKLTQIPRNSISLWTLRVNPTLDCCLAEADIEVTLITQSKSRSTICPPVISGVRRTTLKIAMCLRFSDHP